ncbi:hypothetical protein, partial [Candidatus Chlorohelix sp.]|uniref:hypothetical protein n=1 Tax=Candidatus Chlorohelix sp. TaxID=3139201 RepID=UPI00304FA454
IESAAEEVVEPELEAEVEAAEEVVELELEAEVESAEEVVEPELEAEVESVELTEEEAFFAELEREIAAEKAEAARLALEAAELAELERQIAVITVKSEEVVEPELEPEIEAVALIEPELGSRVAAVEEAATLEPEVAAEEILTHELEVEAASNEPIIELDDADLYEALAKNASEIAPTVVEKLSVPTLEPLMSANIAPETKPLEIKNATPILNSLPLPYNSNASELKTKTTRVAQIEVPLVLQHPGVTEVEKPEQKAKYKLRSLSLFIKILILLSAIILLILLVSFSKAPINTVRLVPNTPAPANSSITTLVSSLNIQASTNDVSQPHLGQELITTLPVLFRDSFTPNYNPKWKMFDNKWNVVNGIFKTIDNRPGTLLLDIGAVQNYELALVTESFALTKSLGIYFEVNGEPTNGTLAASKSYISISFFNCSLYDINTKIDGKPALSTSVTTNYTYCNEDTRYAKPIIIQIKANALYIYTSNNNYKLFKTDLPPGVTVGKIGIVSGGVGISDIRIIGL